MLGKNLPHESRVFPSKVIHPLMLLEKICHQTCPQWRSPGQDGQVGTSSKNTQFFKETLCHDRQWWEICSNSKKKYFIDFSAENYNFEERSWHFQCWASIWIERRKIQIGAIPPPTPPSTHHPDPRIHSHHLQHPLIPSHKYTRLWLQNKQNKAEGKQA